MVGKRRVCLLGGWLVLVGDQPTRVTCGPAGVTGVTTRVGFAQHNLDIHFVSPISPSSTIEQLLHGEV
jgi:hypothetical protein